MTKKRCSDEYPAHDPGGCPDCRVSPTDSALKRHERCGTEFCTLHAEAVEMLIALKMCLEVIRKITDEPRGAYTSAPTEALEARVIAEGVLEQIDR